MASGENETKSPSCSLCSEDGHTSIAGYYCVECETYLCTSCLKSHKLPSLKTHQINRLDCPDLIPVSGGDITVRGSDAVSGQSVKCSLHGKLIDTYCQDHDEVFCGTCVVLKHRPCTTVSIAISSKDYKTSQEIKTYRDKLTKNLDKCKQENEKRKHNRESIDQEKLELIENVDKHEEKIIARIKELAAVSRQEIRSKQEKDTTDLDNHIDTLDVVIATNSDYLNKLDNTDDDELFVLAKMNCKTVIKDGETLIETMIKDWTEKHILFHFDQTLEDCVTEMKSLGQLDNDVDVSGIDVNEYVATFHSNVNVKQGNEGDLSLFDICLFDCNTVLVVDHQNNKLKRLNTDLQFKDEIKLSGYPIAVCKVGNNEVAVRIWNSKVVHFVSVGQSLQLTTSFTFNGNGYGMTYGAEKQEIFACEQNKVSVYSKAGTKLRTYDGEKMLSDCRQISLSDNKQDIYVTDNNNGLIVLDAKKGTLKFKVAVPGVGDTYLLCLLPGGICLVGRWSSDVIVQIDREGKTIGNLIQSKEGRTYTYCAVYDRESKRLLVGGNPSLISTYKLSAK